MKQPIKKTIVTAPKKTKKKTTGKRKHKEYGTSKLEERFAKEFLDKLGVEYQYQFKAESIGRYYDFMLTTKMGGKLLVEIDGDYYHSYGLKHEEKNPMQKHNEYVDKVKDEWALAHGFPIIRIWEHDINKNSSKVMKLLKENIGLTDRKALINEDKKRRH